MCAKNIYVEIKLPVNQLFELKDTVYRFEIDVERYKTLRELLEDINNGILKSNRLKSYLNNEGAGLYVLLNGVIVRNISEKLDNLLKDNTNHISIEILPIFEGG